ncbi:MAG: hypothetical protein LBF19_01185 [Prevotellaceae bacterium]|nr:hypothetical protein [Prevotellaceae bacterium]
MSLELRVKNYIAGGFSRRINGLSTPACRHPRQRGTAMRRQPLYRAAFIPGNLRSSPPLAGVPTGGGGVN